MEGLITKARNKWEALHADDEVEQEMMLPLIRLKVSVVYISMLKTRSETDEDRSRRQMPRR